jgi:hypothetical protein
MTLSASRSGRKLFALLAASAAAFFVGGCGRAMMNVAAVPQSITALPGGLVQGRLQALPRQSADFEFRVVQQPERGQLHLDPSTGLFTYAAPEGFTGEDVFFFLVVGGGIESSPARVIIRVAAISTPGSGLFPTSYVLQEDSTLTASVGPAVGADGPLVYVVVTPPGHGVLVLDRNTGGFVYRPDPDFNGSDSFDVQTVSTRVSEPVVSEPVTMTLNVQPVDDAPVAQPETLELLEDATLSATLTASDVDNAALTYSVTQGPLHGTIDLDEATGHFDYYPFPDWNGSDEFQFIASDGTLTSSPATVTLKVAAVNDPPAAQDQTIAFDEDTVATGRVVASDVDSSVLTYVIAQAPAHGSLQLDAATGAFTYTPQKDYNGLDTFQFTASDGDLDSAPATVTLRIAPVNDPPELPAIPDQTNSAETQDTTIALPLRDVDGDVLSYVVSVADPTVAQARVMESAILAVTPQQRGQTRITITASDGVLQTSTGFQFTVTDVTKRRSWLIRDARSQVVTITNLADHDVQFELRHNGSLLATSKDQLLQEALSLVDEYPGEPFERKLWRYVRDKTHHEQALTEFLWQHEPLLLLNSIGFGLCDDVAIVYVTLANWAGLPARTWGLNGHVIPEVFSGGTWKIYDPDLSVYYLTHDGSVAGMQDFEPDTSVITSPAMRLSAWDLPYSDQIAGFYAADHEKSVWTDWVYPEPRLYGPLVLPAGANIIYPGQWTPTPILYDGTLANASAQLRMNLPPGFSGAVNWPLALWDVQGSGTVRLDGTEYAAGSSELAARLQLVTPGVNDLRDQTRAPRSIEVVSSDGLSLVYLLSATEFSMQPNTDLSLTSLDAAQLLVETSTLPEDQQVAYSSPPTRQGRLIGRQQLVGLTGATATGTLAAFEFYGAVFTFSVAAPPSHGSVTLDSASGLFVYHQDPGYSGPDTFSFTVSDGLVTSIPEVVSILP